MTRKVKGLVFLIIVITVFAKGVRATTYTAASCSKSDVAAIYATEQASAQDGDIIEIPAGTCVWGPSLNWTISPTNSLTIQGAGALIPSTGCSFAPGVACTTTSGSDQTILNDSRIDVTIAPGKTFRITGIDDYAPNGVTDNGTGAWEFVGNNGTQQVHIDHCHFDGYQFHWFAIIGWLFGVADHNWVDERATVAPEDWANVQNGETWNNDSTGNGDKSWADASDWGSSNFFFVENNVFAQDQTTVSVYVNDCNKGGRQIFRYNTYEGKTVSQAHPTAGDLRGCRATESYNNTDNGDGPGLALNAVASVRAGGMLVWGNTGSWLTVGQLVNDRATNTGNGTQAGSISMCGQGYSGTANVTNNSTTVTWVSGASGVQFWNGVRPWPNEAVTSIVLNGASYGIASVQSATSLTLSTPYTGTTGTVNWYVSSIWDGNINMAGYPCLDQSGRGKGDLLTGSLVSSPQSKINSVTGQPSPILSGNNAWPREAVDPVYAWDNNNAWVVDPGNDILGLTPTTIFAPNQDFYIDQFYPTAQTSSSSPFNGSNITQPVSSWSLSSGSLVLTVPSTTGFSTGQTVNVVSIKKGANNVPVRGTYSIASLTPTTVTITGFNPAWTDSSSTAQGWVATIGIGLGTLANRPSTCAAGPGGNTPGVGYWATDQNKLYVCNPTNTWTAYYTPYTYPHPLTQGSQPSVSPPTNLAATPQ